MPKDTASDEVIISKWKHGTMLFAEILFYLLIMGTVVVYLKSIGVIDESCPPWECVVLKIDGCGDHEKAIEKVGEFLSANPDKSFSKMNTEGDSTCVKMVLVFFRKNLKFPKPKLSAFYRYKYPRVTVTK